MICKRCGAAIKNGEIFCAVCGYKFDGVDWIDEQFDNCTRCGRQVPFEAGFCPHCGAPRRFSVNPYSAAALPKRGFFCGFASHRPHRLRIAAAVAAAVIFTAAILLAAMMEAPAAPVVYYNRSTLMAADLDSMKTAELSCSLSLPNDGFMLDFYTFQSADGHYLYYPEPSGDSVTIYRRDLAADLQDPNALVKIDSGIGYPFEVTHDNKAVYIRQPGGGLYVNNGEHRQRIAPDISYFELSADGAKLVYTSTGGDIGYVDMRRLSEEKIAHDATLFEISDDFSTVYYDKSGGLYAHKIGGEQTKIASDISGFIACMQDGTVYYTKSQTKTIRLADLLIDDMRDADSAIGQPDIARYRTLQPVVTSYGGILYEVSTDDEAYTEALNAYTGKLSRDDIRSQADTFAMEFSLDTLYAYKNGKETAVADNFAYSLVSSGDGLLVYKKTVFTPPENIRISDITDINELYVLFNGFQCEDANVYATFGGRETLIVSADTPSLATDNSFVYSHQDGKLYYLGDYDTAASSGTLCVITVNGNGFSAPQTVAGDVGTFAVDARTNALFTITHMENGGGNLYRNSVKIDSGVNPSSILLSTNGLTLYYLNHIHQNGGTLMKYTGGVKKRIADNVSEAALISDRLVFIVSAASEGGLYVYAEGRPHLIDDGVCCLIDTQAYGQPSGLNFIDPELLDAE